MRPTRMLRVIVLAAAMAALSLAVPTAGQARPAAVVAPTSPAAVAAAPALFTVLNANCNFTAVTGDAVVDTVSGVNRGFVSFHGGTCGQFGVIRFFQGSGSSWTSGSSVLRGRVLGVDDDGTFTWLLYQSAAGIFVTSRPHTGGTPAGTQVSDFTGSTPIRGDIAASGGQYWAIWSEQAGVSTKLFESRTVGGGTCSAPILKRQITFNSNLDDGHPTITLEPAAAGASGLTLYLERMNRVTGTSSKIWKGTSGCDATWSFAQYSFQGQMDMMPDAYRVDECEHHVVWQRNGRIFHNHELCDVAAGHLFNTPGSHPRTSVSQDVMFVAWNTTNGSHPFFATDRSGGFAGIDLTPGAGQQELVALTSQGGRAMVLAATFVTDRLYAVPNL